MVDILREKLPAGTLVQERFRIMKVLGSTVYGHKYAAIDCCLTGGKWILVEEAQTPPSGNLMKKIGLPMLEAYAGIVEDGGRLFTRWEDYEWPGLDSVVFKDGKLGEKEALSVTLKVVRTVKALLDRGIAAFGLRPSSLLISSWSETLLTSLHFRSLRTEDQESVRMAEYESIQQVAKLLYFMLTGIELNSEQPPAGIGQISSGTARLIPVALSAYDPKEHRMERFEKELAQLSFLSKFLPQPRSFCTSRKNSAA